MAALEVKTHLPTTAPMDTDTTEQVQGLDAEYMDLPETKERMTTVDEETGLDDVDDQREIKLISKDNGVFSVPRNVATLSELVKTMIEGDEDADEIPLPK